jgi:hypothetical protein
MPKTEKAPKKSDVYHYPDPRSWLVGWYLGCGFNHREAGKKADQWLKKNKRGQE